MKSSKLWSSQLWKQFNQLSILKPAKSQDLKGVWTHDLVIPLRCSNELRDEATDVGSWWFVGPKEPVRNECEIITCNMKYFMYWTADVKSSKLWSSQLWKQFMQLSIQKPAKSQDFNRVWTCDLVTAGLCSNQLSYEATDVGSGSFVGPMEPVRNECEVICEIFEILNCRSEMKEAMILAVMNAIYASAYVEA